ncbi:tRNA-dihydrouridine synthase family protein [Candidatus Woesearchaeota archaeon]|nr:tRNA-dihydrouridine synthase family protein [Candidatus Woesearchaeota archaeon]
MIIHLAPLEGTSDCAFRTLCYNYGADVTYTEMIRVDALLRKNKSTLNMLDLKNETPTVIQLLALKPAALQKFVDTFDFYNVKPVGFNLNLGCPSPDVISEGSGAALIKRVARVQELVTILKKLGLPVTVKMRLGLNQYEKEHKVYLNLLNGVDADAFIVHARHARENSTTPADWTVFEEIIATGKKIIANGDITKFEDIEYFRKLGITEVMIARAAVRDPSVFRILKGKAMVSLDTVKRDYETLCEMYPNHPKYKENVWKYLGRKVEITSG